MIKGASEFGNCLNISRCLGERGTNFQTFKSWKVTLKDRIQRGVPAWLTSLKASEYRVGISVGSIFKFRRPGRACGANIDRTRRQQSMSAELKAHRLRMLVNP